MFPINKKKQYIFVYNKIKGFIKKLIFGKKKKWNYDYFETFQTFIAKNDLKVTVIDKIWRKTHRCVKRYIIETLI